MLIIIINFLFLNNQTMYRKEKTFVKNKKFARQKRLEIIHVSKKKLNKRQFKKKI